MPTPIFKSLTILVPGLRPLRFSSTTAGQGVDGPGVPAPGSSGNEQILAAIVFWILFVLFVLLVALGCFMGVVPGLVLLVVGLMIVHRWWTARQHAPLWTMAVCAERLIPLGTAIRAFAAERVFAGRTEQLADMLEAGVTLPEALEATPFSLSADARAKIRVGHDSGALALSIRDVIAVREEHESFWNAAVGRILYILAVLFFAMMILAFMMLKIAPEFEKIFSEFDAALPAMTQSLIYSSYVATNYWPLVFGPILAVLLGLLTYAVLRYLGVLGPGAPGFRWLERRLITATILENLALVAQRGRPMLEGVGILAATYPSRTMRVRLAKVLRDVRAGADWCESLAARRLIGKPDLAVLQAAQRAGNLPWALKEMAQSNRRRQAYRVQVWVQFLFPLAILTVGLMVAWIVISFFMPLISLIRALT